MRSALYVLVALLLVLSPASSVSAQSPSPTPRTGIEITSPLPGSTIGGLVAIMGTISVPRMQGYTLSFAPSRDTAYWIDIEDAGEVAVTEGRIALWDTTRIPDGRYALRVRVSQSLASEVAYVDTYVDDLLVSNAPRTPTPYPTAAPTHTSTATPVPSATPTRQPTPSLDDGASPYLYLTVALQHDPLCPEWQQRVGIWVSNVGAVTVTNIIVVDTLPPDIEPELVLSSAGATLQPSGQVSWEIGDLGPGQAQKLELEMRVQDWVQPGTWLTNEVMLSSDQVPYLTRSTTFLRSECAWLIPTLTALPVRAGIPTETPTVAPAVAPTVHEGQALTRPTAAWPTATAIVVSIPEGSVESSLDMLTTVIIVFLGLLAVIMFAMLYQRLKRRR